MDSILQDRVGGIRTPSLRLRLTVLVVGTMLPLALLSAATIFQSYRSAREIAAERVLQSTRSGIASVDRELRNIIAGLEVLASSSALQAGEFAEFRREAERYAARYGSEGLVVLSERSGQEVLNTGITPGQPLPKRIEEDAVQAVFATGKIQISDMHFGATQKRPVFTVDIPVTRGGQVIYDLSFNPPRRIFFTILDQLRLPEGWIVSIFDRRNQHVARKPVMGGDQEITRVAPTLETFLIKSDEAIAPSVSLEGTPLLSAFSRSSETGWTVAIGLPADTISGPARRSFLIAMAASAALVIIGIAFAGRLAAHLARAESQRVLLVNELNHRVKNTLSAVQAIVSRSLRGAHSPAEARAAIDSRLMALSQAHNSLSASAWSSGRLREIVEAVLGPFLDDKMARAQISGPDVRIKPRMVIALALVLNELATNAAKYGALSGVGGTVRLAWSTAGPTLHLEWREAGGPPVAAPARSGYGTTFIERAVTQELAGTVGTTYDVSGVVCIIDVPL